jgi:hypothetical protein
MGGARDCARGGGRTVRERALIGFVELERNEEVR